MEGFLKVEEFQVIKDDPYLEPHKGFFEHKAHLYNDLLHKIKANEGSLAEFSQGYKKYGFQVREDGILFREWLPGAKEVYLLGDFNEWRRFPNEFPLKRDSFGNWEIFFPKNKDGTHRLTNKSKVKLHLKNARDEWVDRIPAWTQYAIQDEKSKTFDGVFMMPSEYKWLNQRPKKPENLKVYECHVGMSGIEQRVHSYKEFTKNVIPRVAKLGYNCIQIMAIQEHAYYGSFGYHVTNFFAVSSRSGEPDDFRELVDTAHGLGLIVLIDLVHSHASANALDGIGEMDGTGHQYFHEGEKGRHRLWDSMCFNYGHWEVLRFLLSNLRFFIEEYRIDGFRFDGITSMLYTHHGIGTGFSGGYHEYFGPATDFDSLVYLMFGNNVIRQAYPVNQAACCA